MENLIPKEKEDLIKQAIEDMTVKVRDLKIDSQESLEFASHLLGEVKVRIKRLTALKAELTKPMADAVKQANNWFKMQSEPFEKMEFQIKQAMSVWVDEQEKKARAEQKRLDDIQAKKEAAAKKKGAEPPPPPPAPIEQPRASVQTEHGRVVSKKIWTWDVTDEAKIPREFLTVDRAKVTAAVRDGKRRIAGVKIHQKTSISA